MNIEIINGVETIVGGEGAAPFDLYKDKVVQKFFWKKESETEEEETSENKGMDSGKRPVQHIAFICEYRKSLGSDFNEKRQFFNWVVKEYRRLVSTSIYPEVEGDRLVIVQHVLKFQEDYAMEMQHKIYKFVKTEYFFSHAEDAFWIADNYDGHDMYEMICENTDLGPEDIDEDFTNAWLHDKGYSPIFSLDAEEPTMDYKDLEERAASFWMAFPVYRGDLRQYFIHEALKKERAQEKVLEQFREANKKKAKPKKRRHR